jgi:hypothetical protein
MKSLIYKRIKQLSIIGALVSIMSCEVTDLTPPDIIPGDVVFTSPDRVNNAVIGVYEAAQRGWYLGAVQRGYPFGAASIQQGDMRGEDMYNDQLFYEVTYTGNYTPTTANNNGQWESLYRVINRANIVMEGLVTAVSNGVISQDIANNYRGEMLFMRALSHHELLINFSRPYSDSPSSPGVPYRTFAIDDVAKVELGLQVGRGTVGEGYTALLRDLDEAEGLMTDGSVNFRARKGAVIALKARIKLHMRDWNGVMSEYNKISSLYSLAATPEGPFVNFTGPESIFSLENSAASNPGVNGALVNMYGDPALGGRGLVKVSPLIWKADWWLQNDKRRTLLTSRNTARGIFTTKYRAFGSFAEPTPLIRFAEIVLAAAEAQARLNNLDAAVALLNSVRDRALEDLADSYTASGLGSQQNVLEAIWREERIEFLAEGRRWPQIHRLSGEGIMNGVPPKAQSRSVTNLTFYVDPNVNVTLDHSFPYADYRMLWPIPQQELNTNETLKNAQNPGY